MNNTIQLVGITGSLRKASTNRGLLQCAHDNLPAGVSLDILDLNGIPFFNADHEQEPHPPELADALERMRKAQGFIFACNEYNYSIAPALKNIIDWASRAPNNEILKGKAVAIMGSGGGMGTSRAQYHLRQVCVYVNLLPLNRELFSNAFAGAFNAEGQVQEEALIQNVREHMFALQSWIKRLNP